MFLVDSHVNLHGEQFADDLEQVVERAQNAGVGTMLNICCKTSEFDAVLAVAEKFDNMYASVGTHPHEARENPDIKASEIIELSRHAKVIGIGETGLDFHYNYSDRDDQYANFLAHIDAARQTQLPLIIHSRNADKEMAELLETEMKKGEFPALLHCYTGGAELARRAADLGLYFALSGILTFKNAHELREISKDLPEDRLLIETDCPYLAPMPHRGRRNEPAWVVRVAEDLATLKGWSLEDTANRTTDAFFNLFTKAKRPKT
ncbi:TatD family hydrolase [bacterium AH-315-J19]|nr:TatD family hydrolase [Robiginitomaculum sp.]MBN4058584.1 TatD family hydrolase [bacterium AH-315-J19]